MFILYVIAVIVLGNNSFVLPMDQPTPFIIAYGQSALNFRNSLNPNDAQSTIELNPLNVQQKQEQKNSLPKSIKPTKKDRMHVLYNKVDHFLASENPHYEALIQCINACKYVKRFGINEDQMGRYAFFHDNMTLNRRTSLLFYFLKHYNKQAAAMREIPPKMWSPLAKHLNLVDSCNSIEILIDDTNALFFKKIPHYDELISFIHSRQKFSQLCDNFVFFDIDWQKQFVYDAFSMLCLSEHHDTLYDIVTRVSSAKSQKMIQQESDLGYYILSYEPTWLDRLEMGSLTVSYDDSQKRRIALLCLCIENYNEARGEKITPSARLYRIYKAIEPLHLLLPDAFDKDLLDPKKIAFAEYTELLDDIDKLKQAYDKAVEYCIKKLYPQELSTITKF